MKFLAAIAVCALSLALPACSTNPAIAKFNAAAVPRITEDAQVAGAAAANSAAEEVTRQLTSTGAINVPSIGIAAGIAAVGALINLDVGRAQGTASATVVVHNKPRVRMLVSSRRKRSLFKFAPLDSRAIVAITP